MCCRIPHKEIGMVRKTKMPAMNQALLWVPTWGGEGWVRQKYVSPLHPWQHFLQRLLFLSAVTTGATDITNRADSSEFGLPCLSAAPRCRVAERPPIGESTEPEPVGGSTSSTLPMSRAWRQLNPQRWLQAHAESRAAPGGEKSQGVRLSHTLTHALILLCTEGKKQPPTV